MPIKIPNDLPATAILQSENIFVMTETRALTQDIRPLEILILNLMPTKIDTETQFARLLGNTPLQVRLSFLHTQSHVATHVPKEHLFAFYKTFDEVRSRRFDGMIITGAPVEHLPFEQVEYWQELCAIMEWSKTHVHSTLHICWGAQAGMYFHYGIHKYEIGRKLSGIYRHKVLNLYHPLMRGFDDYYYAPHSRYTEVRKQDIQKCRDLVILSESDMAGVHITASKNGRQIFISGHAEYDRDTLMKEYFRDVNRGLDPDIPYNYFPQDDPSQRPPFVWRSNAHLMISNWLNYFVYQQTPYNLEELQEY